MSHVTPPDPLDPALRLLLAREDEPADAGFSLRVMAALPPPVSRRQRQWVRWLRRAHWLALSGAGCGAAALLAGDLGTRSSHLLAGLALVGLLIFWTVPNRWHRP